MKNLVFVACIGAMLTLWSCNDDPVNPNDERTFSQNSVAQNKENIENIGLDMVSEMEIMQNEPAMDVNAAMIYFMDESDPIDGMKSVSFRNIIGYNTIKSLANFSETGTEGLLKSMNFNQNDDPESLQEMFDELVGVYEWNSSALDWDYTKAGSKITIKFPSTKTGTVNNAEYNIEYTGINLSPSDMEEDLYEDYTGDLPASTKATLTLDGEEMSSINGSATYHSNGVPSTISLSVVVGTFVMSGSANNNNTAANIEYSFKHNDEVLILAHADASGNWDIDNIDANTIRKYYSWEYDEELGYGHEVEVTKNDNYSWYSDEVAGENILSNGNFLLQAMDVKVLGTVDIKNYIIQMNEIEWPNYNPNLSEEETNDLREEASEEDADAFNENVNLTLRYVDNNEIIAVCEMYVERYTEENCWDEYDWETDTYNEVCHEYERIESKMRFVFADGSSTDAEIYFEEVFEEIEDELINFFEDLEDSWDD